MKNGQKIDIDLDLHGQDALDFFKYMEHPTYTPAAHECMKAALDLPGRKTE